MTTPLENDPILHSVPIVDGHKKIDSYLLQRRLGTGGMGAVYLGRHETLGSRAAVKCLLPSASLSEDALQRFWREAQIAANIESPNLIHVHHLGESHGVHFMVMEFIDGENAEQRVGRSGPLAPREALTIIHNACRGLAAGHENDPIVVHRDIKPQNIMVSKSGDVKVADLGIARVESGEILTLDKSVFGTPNYMSPEQFEAAKDAKTASDVYSMGATLYYLLVGDHPYAGLSLAKIMKEVEVGFPDIAALRPDLPSAVVELVRDATIKQMAARPQNARELMGRVRAVLDELGGVVDLSFGTAEPGSVSKSAWINLVRAPTKPSTTPATLPDGALKAATPQRHQMPSQASVAMPQSTPQSTPLRSPPKKVGAGSILGIVLALVVIGGGAYAYSQWGGGGGPSPGPIPEPGPNRHDVPVSTARDQLPSWQQFANDVLGGTTKSDYLRHAEDCFKLAAFGNELSALSMSDRIAVAAALRRLQWANSASRAGDLLAQVPVRDLIDRDVEGAMRAGEPERLRSVLLAVGRDVTAPDAGRSRLTEAILMRKIPGARSPGSLAVCRELLYAEGHGRTMAEEVPGLVYAAESGDLDIVAMLLDSGADVARAQGNGVNALHAAASAGQAEVCRVLLAANPDATRLLATVASDRRALEFAAESLSLPTCKVLLDACVAHRVPLVPSGGTNAVKQAVVEGISRDLSGAAFDEFATLLGLLAKSMRAEGVANCGVIHGDAMNLVAKMQLNDEHKLRLENALASLR